MTTLKTLRGFLLLLFTMLVWVSSAVWAEDAKNIMDEGAAGKFSLVEKCPDSLKGAKDQVPPEDLVKYVTDNHKTIMDKEGHGYPDQAYAHLKSILDAAAAIQCQAAGESGKDLGKTDVDRWLKVFSTIKDKKNKAFADAVLDAGYMLLKDGSQVKSLPYFKAATKLDADNETGYLFAGDALWDLRKFSESKAEYKKYNDMRRDKYGPHAPILARVQERTGVKPVKVIQLKAQNPAQNANPSAGNQ